MWKDLSETEKIRLMAAEDDRELKGIDEGVARYHRSAENMTLSTPQRKAVLLLIESVAQAIKNDQGVITKGLASRGRPNTWAPAYVTMCPYKLALITLHVCIKCDESQKLTVRASALASRVKLEHELEEVIRINQVRSKEEKGFRKNFLDKIIGDDKKIRKLFKKMTGRSLQWDITQRLGLGTRLIQALVCSNTGWSLEIGFKDSKSIYFIKQSDELKELLSDWTSTAEIRMPSLHPMSCPPIPWVQSGTQILGGYKFGCVECIKYVGESAQHKPNLDNHDISYVLSAVNAIQNVEWRIDTDTLALAESIINCNDSRYDCVIPSARPKPWLDPIAKGSTKSEIKVWRQKKDTAIAAYYNSIGVRIAASFAIAEARKFKTSPVFFVHTIDWRGRIYPAPTALNPQGTDLQKALIRYNERIALGPNGLRQLKIWAAGCAGIDKVSLNDRVKWWDDNWGNDPDTDNNMRWVEYDDPFLFVQAAREIRNAIASKDPPTFMSDLSVCKDGSQNGLQHLSAMGLDEIGGSAVNLLNGAIPLDLYASVADLVLTSVIGDSEASVASGKVVDDFDQPLPPLVWEEELQQRKKRRSVVKRSVLAYPYGVTKSGMSNGLLEDGFTDELQGSKHKNAWYLAGKIDEAVRDVVVSAAKIMDWFRSVANILADRELPVEWIAPSGFPCCMRYLVQEEKRISVNNVKLSIRSDTKKISPSSQVRGVVANIVHSYDASHLVATCHRMVEQKYTSFHFIHDSYGSHAGHLDFLELALREEFVKIYKNDVLGAFYANIKDIVDIPEPPTKGDLDIEKVLESSFFFS